MKALLRSRSRISRVATSVIARLPLIAPPAPGRAPRATGAVAEPDHLRRPFGGGKHCLRIDVAIDQEAEVAVRALDHVDAPNLRFPLRWRAVESQRDPPSLRGAPQRIETSLGDDPSAVDDRDLLADLLHEIELVAREEHRDPSGGLVAEHLRERSHRDGVEAGERLVEDEEVRRVHERCRELSTLLVAVRRRARQSTSFGAPPFIPRR